MKDKFDIALNNSIKSLQTQYTFKQRGNRHDYIISDCTKDADLDYLSTGIISLYKNKTDIWDKYADYVCVWGFLGTFVLPENEKTQNIAIAITSDIHTENVFNYATDNDDNTISVSGQYRLDIKVYANNLYQLDKIIWNAFNKNRKPLEKIFKNINKALDSLEKSE